MFIDKAAFLNVIRDYMVQERMNHVNTLGSVRTRNVAGEYMSLSRLIE